MKHDAAHYEAVARGCIDLAGETRDRRTQDQYLSAAQTWATLAVAAATLEAQRPHYPAGHPLADTRSDA